MLLDSNVIIHAAKPGREALAALKGFGSEKKASSTSMP